jgi:putative phosphoribosyl transferase
MTAQGDLSHEVSIAIDARSKLCGRLCVPDKAVGVVILAHVASSSRNVARNHELARALQREKLATLLLDLLSAHEEESDRFRRRLHFDVALLAGRLILTQDSTACAIGM